jgi:hypothetical protein
MPAGDIASSTDVYYVPYLSDEITVWNGSAWEKLAIPTSAPFLSVSAPDTVDQLFDIFIWKNGSGVLELEISSWSSGTARAQDLYIFDGVRVKENSTEGKKRRWLGTAKTLGTLSSGNGVVADTVKARLLYNFYNKVPRKIENLHTTSSWTQAQENDESWELPEDSAGFQVGIVAGEHDVYFIATAMRVSKGDTTKDTNGTFRLGIALDSQSAPDGDCTYQLCSTVNRTGSDKAKKARDLAVSELQLVINDNDDLGYHYIQPLEAAYGGVTGSPVTTVYGTDNCQSGLQGFVVL